MQVCTYPTVSVYVYSNSHKLQATDDLLNLFNGHVFNFLGDDHDETPGSCQFLQTDDVSVVVDNHNAIVHDMLGDGVLLVHRNLLRS